MPTNSYVTITELFIQRQPEPEHNDSGISVTDKFLEFIQRFREDCADEETCNELEAIAHARRDFGKIKYKTELKTSNGRWSPADVAQEQFDKTLYMVQAWLEGYATRAMVLKDIHELIAIVDWIKDLREKQLS